MAPPWGCASSAPAGRTSTFCVSRLLSKRKPLRKRRRLSRRSTMTWENEAGTFALGDFAAEKGGVIRDAKLAWQRFGKLTDKRDNLILYPSSYSARLADMSWLIGPEGILDPTRWCIIAMGMFSNGESSGAAETPDYPALVTVADNVRAQHRLVREMCGVDKLAAVYGFSMGGMQAYHWAAL